MTRSLYPDQDDVFGHLMRTLRSRMGITQSELATRLGVSRHAVADWEIRGKHPTVQHLQEFISLAVQHKVFSGVKAADDIRSLWSAANQKVLLDEAWLSQLLATELSPSLPARSIRDTRLHWDDA